MSALLLNATYSLAEDAHGRKTTLTLDKSGHRPGWFIRVEGLKGGLEQEVGPLTDDQLKRLAETIAPAAGATRMYSGRGSREYRSDEFTPSASGPGALDRDGFLGLERAPESSKA